MTTYKTGNPIGSTDPRDLYDNAENLDEAVNSSADTFQDRLGKSRLTWLGITKAGTGDTSVAIDAADRAVDAVGQAENEADRAADAAGQAENEADRADDAASRAENAEAIVDATNIQNYVTQAEAARDAAFVNADVYPSVATGRAAVADGEQFQVANGDEIVRYRRDGASTQTEVARYPSASSVARGQSVVSIYDPLLVFKGYAESGAPAPTALEGECYIAAASGTVFGLLVEKGQLLIRTISGWRIGDMYETAKKTTEAGKEVKFLSENSFSIGAFVNANGQLVTDGNYRTTYFKPVSQGDSITYLVAASASVCAVSFWDAEFAFVSGILGTNVFDEYVGVVPDGVKYVRLSSASYQSVGEYARIKVGSSFPIEDAIQLVNSSRTRYESRRRATFAFVFDDLNNTDALVYSVFKDYGFIPSFALQTNRLNSVNAVEYQQYYVNGCSILAHSINHPNMGSGTALTPTEIEEQMAVSRNEIESYGMKVSGWVTPYSVLGEQFLPIAEKYFGYGFTHLNSGGFDYNVDPLRMTRYSVETAINKDDHSIADIEARIDQAIVNKELLVLYAHRIPSSLKDNSEQPAFNESDLRAVLSYLREKEDAGLCRTLSCDEAVQEYYRTPY